VKKFYTLMLLAALSTISSQAAVITQITLDTSSLKVNVGSPFSLAFELGGGSESGNNTAILSNFNFGTGSAAGSPILVGGALGDLTSGLTLTDSDVDNIFIEGVSFGDLLSFNLTLTTNVDFGGTPDDFIWSILDSTETPVPTTSSSPLFPLLAITIDSSHPSVGTFDGTFPYFFSAPTVTDISNVSSTPEPSTAVLVGLGLLSTLCFSRRKSGRNAINSCDATVTK
jgi:hypothetical protein